MRDPYERHLAEVIGVREETSSTKTFTVRFVDEAMQRQFAFAPGQFIVISFQGVGEAMFSISSSTSNRESFDTTIKKVGRVTTKIHTLRTGDELWVAGPFGNGWPVDQLKDKDVLIIAGGVGLPSPRPVILHIQDHRDDFRFLEILYGTKTPLESIFSREYDEWTKIPRTKLALTADYVPEGVEWKHPVGVVTNLLSQLATAPKNAAVLICGPEVMMHFTVQSLLRQGFQDSQIYLSLERRMRCGIAQCGHCQLGPLFVCKDGPVLKYSDIRGLPDCGI
jgi:NAD(P)H-flavin reductase